MQQPITDPLINAPHADPLERAVLCLLISNPDAILILADFLAPDLFFKPTHRDILAAICDLHRRGDRPSEEHVLAELGNSVAWQRTLSELMNSDPLPISLGGTWPILETLRDFAAARAAVSLASRIVQAAYQSPPGATIRTALQTFAREADRIVKDYWPEAGESHGVQVHRLD